MNVELESKLEELRALYRAYYVQGRIYHQGCVDELQSCLNGLGYEISKAILIPAKTLLRDNDAPLLENASEASLLSPKKSNDQQKISSKKRRPIDEPTFLEFLGSIEIIELPGQNTDVWRYIFKRTPLNFAGIIFFYVHCDFYTYGSSDRIR